MKCELSAKRLKAFLASKFSWAFFSGTGINLKMYAACRWLVTGLARKYILTALYLITAWALMVSYQIFTQQALATVSASLSGPAPVLSTWLSSSSEAAGFICSFAWMFRSIRHRCPTYVWKRKTALHSVSGKFRINLGRLHPAGLTKRSRFGFI